jgi:hypothetical protein
VCVVFPSPQRSSHRVSFTLFTRFCSSSPCTATFLTVTLSVYLYLSILAVALNFLVFPCLSSLLVFSLVLCCSVRRFDSLSDLSL